MADPAAERPHGVRRIVVALDESQGSMAALESVARLAAGLRAELVGLFIEDASFLEAAALGVSRTVPTTAAGAEAVGPETMERALRLLARRIEQRFLETATRWNLAASFRTGRGAIADQLASAGGTSDLLALGRTGRPRSLRRALGTTARRIAEQAPCPVLLLPGISHGGRPVTALYEGSGRVLDLAAELARGLGNDLQVVVVAEDATLRSRAATWLADHGLEADLQLLDGTDAPTRLEAIGRLQAAVVVLDPAGPLVTQLGLSNVIAHLEEPLLIVHGEAAA